MLPSSAILGHDVNYPCDAADGGVVERLQIADRRSTRKEAVSVEGLG